MVANLRRIRARAPQLRDSVFAKVGDSVTHSGYFLHCLGRPPARLGEHAELLPTWERFLHGDAAGTNPFCRESQAAHIGWSSYKVLEGPVSPLQREVSQILPRFALVMFGTNDIEVGSLHHFANSMFDIVDWLIGRGVIPILFTIMPRDDGPKPSAAVPRYNAVIRGLAQGRQVPLVDYHHELLSLPGHGLVSDGVHPSAYRGRLGRDACDFSPQGLRHGFNLRNLLALQALHRVSRILTDPAAAPEPEGEPLAGTGTAQDPFLVDQLPFVDARAVSGGPDTSPHAGPCPSARPATGPRLFYRMTIRKQTTVWAIGFDRGGVEVDLGLLRGLPGASRCLKHHSRVIVAMLQPGTYTLAMSPVTRADGGAGRGESLLALLPSS